MANAASKLPGRVTTTALCAAAAWAVALLVAAFVVPVYGSATATSSRVVADSAETFVHVNGLHGTVVIAVPLVCTVIVASALLLRSRRGALPCAWALTAALAAANLLAMLTIGLFVLPVTAALVVACAASTGRPPAVTPDLQVQRLDR